MNKLKDLWKNNKKAFLLYGGIGILGIIILVVAIFLIFSIFKRYDYYEIENMLVKASTNYLNKHKDLIPNEEEDEIVIEASSLIQEKYLKDFSKLTRDTTCSGYVTVNFLENNLRYTPSLECMNYQTKSLKDVILEKETIQTSTDGLYDINDYYTYRGEFVNNYISFAGYTFRILKFNEEEMQLILADTINNKVTYVFDDRYNETIESNRGKNDFNNSRVFLSLRDIYQNDFVKFHKYILPIEACTNPRSEKDRDKSGSVECYTTTTTHLSMLPVYDYLNASLDPLCLDVSSRNCSNYNYLSKTKNRWWLINGTNENTYEVYSADPLGKIRLDSANSKRDLRPVLSIPSTLIYKTGDGTSSSPYEFFEF